LFTEGASLRLTGVPVRVDSEVYVFRYILNIVRQHRGIVENDYGQILIYEIPSNPKGADPNPKGYGC